MYRLKQEHCFAGLAPASAPRTGAVRQNIPVLMAALDLNNEIDMRTEPGPTHSSPRTGGPRGECGPGQKAGLQARLTALGTSKPLLRAIIADRIAALDSGPAATSARLQARLEALGSSHPGMRAQLERRIAALERNPIGNPARVAGGGGGEMARLQARLATVDPNKPGLRARIEQRIAALESNPIGNPSRVAGAGPGEKARLQARLAAVDPSKPGLRARIEQRIAAGDIDFFIANTSNQSKVARDRQGDIEAGVKVFDTLIEIGDIFAVITCASANADWQDGARAGTNVDPGIV